MHFAARFGYIRSSAAGVAHGWLSLHIVCFAMAAREKFLSEPQPILPQRRRWQNAIAIAPVPLNKQENSRYFERWFSIPVNELVLLTPLQGRGGEEERS